MVEPRLRIAPPDGGICCGQGIILSPFDEDAIQRRRARRMQMSRHSISALGVIKGDLPEFEARGSMAARKSPRVHTLITGGAASPDILAHTRSQGVAVVVARNGKSKRTLRRQGGSSN